MVSKWTFTDTSVFAYTDLPFPSIIRRGNLFAGSGAVGIWNEKAFVSVQLTACTLLSHQTGTLCRWQHPHGRKNRRGVSVAAAKDAVEDPRPFPSQLHVGLHRLRRWRTVSAPGETAYPVHTRGHSGKTDADGFAFSGFKGFTRPSFYPEGRGVDGRVGRTRVDGGGGASRVGHLIAIDTMDVVRVVRSFEHASAYGCHACHGAGACAPSFFV